MTVHLQPITYVLRLYRDGDSFEQHSPYCGSATVQVIGDSAYISGLCGTITRQHYHDIEDALRAEGAAYIVFNKRNSTRVITL